MRVPGRSASDCCQYLEPNTRPGEADRQPIGARMLAGPGNGMPIGTAEADATEQTPGRAGSWDEVQQASLARATPSHHGEIRLVAR